MAFAYCNKLSSLKLSNKLKTIDSYAFSDITNSATITFCGTKEDWDKVEKEKTLWTTERNLPRLMKEAGIVSSISEVRRNQPKLCVDLNDVDFLKVKWGKRFLFILVGE